MGSNDLATLLAVLFDAERTLREAHTRLTMCDPLEVLPILEDAVRSAAKLDEDERSLRWVRIAELLGDMSGGRAIDLLIDILASQDIDARHAAGEALSELAWERFKDVALGVERALARLPADSPALLEIPYIICEIPEPGALKLLSDFLGHRDPHVVAASVEALVERADPQGITLLKPLAGDQRVVELQDDEGADGKATLGELVTEATAMLGERKP